MESAGIVRRSSSPWSSPLLVVDKPDGSVRPCGDYRRLNRATRKDRYNLPSLRDFSHNLAGMTCFSTIDLLKAYWQVGLTESAIPKTAVITPFGLWEFLKLPFGVCNAVPTFQRLIDSVMAGLPYVFVYLDDLLIFSPDPESHEVHLRAVLSKLREAGLTANPSKCAFFQSSVNYLGHRVSNEGVFPLEKHLDAIERYPPPSDVKV
ncbi:MAG: reverse transcriptase family protein, partial [Cyanobacteria bacterium J06553_1]